MANDNPTYIKLVEVVDNLLYDGDGDKVALAWGESTDIVDAIWPEVQSIIDQLTTAMTEGAQIALATAEPQIVELMELIGKLAPALFNEREGGGHDLGMWLDCGDITESEYELLKEVIDDGRRR